ncbi:hypothetical protein JVU11DRAFT_2770 [Chiua virens]|nr:hypothetical protein JVU11DRAFT_2770 [Chiua virens]
MASTTTEWCVADPKRSPVFRCLSSARLVLAHLTLFKYHPHRVSSLPSGIVDSHLQFTLQSGTCDADINHLESARRRAVVLSSRGHSPQAIVSSLISLQADLTDARVLSVLIPFSLSSTDYPTYIHATDTPLPALTTVYDGAITVAAEAEEDAKDQAQVETPAKNLRWALEHSRVVDIEIERGIIATDASFYDSFVNLLTKAIKSDANTKRTPIVLSNLLPPPLESVLPVVTMMNHPSYTTFRQRVSLLSLFENVHVKLLPPAWALPESTARSEGKLEEMELKNIIKLFIVPVLEAFGFERIIYGSSPAFASGSPELAENWYKSVLESFRELAVSQD